MAGTYPVPHLKKASALEIAKLNRSRIVAGKWWRMRAMKEEMQRLNDELELEGEIEEELKREAWTSRYGEW